MDPTTNNDAALAAEWLDAVARPRVVSALEAVYLATAEAIAARGPACWASGRCCNFAKTGHLLYVTGLEAAYTVSRLTDRPALTEADIGRAREVGGCPFQVNNLCGVHPIRPLGCRVYFCDKSAQAWQQDLYERELTALRTLHDAEGIPYRYAEWRSLLELLVRARMV